MDHELRNMEYTRNPEQSTRNYAGIHTTHLDVAILSETGKKGNRSEIVNYYIHFFSGVGKVNISIIPKLTSNALLKKTIY